MICLDTDEVYKEDFISYGTDYKTHIYVDSEEEALDWFHNNHAIKCLDDWEISIKKDNPQTEEPKTAPKNNAKEGKPRASLIPWDILLEYLCPAYEEGIIKYVRESWREGFKVTDMYDALQRHLTAFFFDREDYDPDAAKLGVKKHHLAGAMFCILSILWTLKTHPELDDRPKHNLPPEKPGQPQCYGSFDSSKESCSTCTTKFHCVKKTPIPIQLPTKVCYGGFITGDKKCEAMLRCAAETTPDKGRTHAT